MALSNTAVPIYYGQFRDAVVRGEIPVNREISAEMNRIDDLIEIHTKPTHAGGARLVLEQQVKLGDAVLVAAKVTVVMINLEGKARRMPATLRSTLGMPEE